MAKKFKFTLKGTEFNLPMKYLQTKDWSGNDIEPYINLTHAATASVLKQWVKKEFPKVTVYSSSESFSGGNSAKIWVSDSVGNEIFKPDFDTIRDFARLFQQGSFNGMIDLYEYDSQDLETEKGTPIKLNTKWVSAVNGPKHATLPDAFRMFRQMTTTDTYVFGQVTAEEAVKQMKSFGVSDKNIQKVLNSQTV